MRIMQIILWMRLITILWNAVYHDVQKTENVTRRKYVSKFVKVLLSEWNENLVKNNKVKIVIRSRIRYLELRYFTKYSTVRCLIPSEFSV